ncbi:MAG: FKBP-type peptidyl-prolyl cis-trans isomerase [Arenicella sp.]|jgi:FKBP-type peptidyl-prolyl cis-trans isomerase
MKYAILLILIATLPMQAIAKLSLAEQGRAFLEQNQHNEGVIVTKSGLQYKILVQGNSKNPTTRSRVTIDYQGKHADNSVFDSTFNDEPLVLSLRKTIKGWKEGLQFIGEGGRIVLFVPSRLAYGRKGAPPSIARNETLIFIIDLLEVEN